LPPFGAISQDDFRQLLRYLIDIDHVQQTEQGRLIIGLTGEKVVRSFNFTPCLQITKSIQSGMTRWKQYYYAATSQIGLP